MVDSVDLNLSRREPPHASSCGHAVGRGNLDINSKGNRVFMSDKAKYLISKIYVVFRSPKRPSLMSDSTVISQHLASMEPLIAASGRGELAELSVEIFRQFGEWTFTQP